MNKRIFAPGCALMLYKPELAARILLEKMNIKLVEPAHTRTRSTCCGDSFYGVLSTDQVKKQMVKRTSEMPVIAKLLFHVL